MKAIIMDIEDKYLIVATKNGLFKKIRNTYPNCELGDEIDIPAGPQIFDLLINLRSCSLPTALPLKKVVAAFIVMFFMISGYAVADYMRPVTFVSMDVNPSFELALNRYQRVLTVKGLDEDGEKIAKNVMVKNLPVDEVIKILLNQVNTSENIKSTEINTVMLAVCNINDKIPEGLEEKLEQTAREEAQKLNTQKSTQSTIESHESPTKPPEQAPADKKTKPIKIVVKDTTIDKHREAAKKQLSQGKLLLYEKIKEVKPSTTLDEIKATSLSTLIGELERISDTKRDQPSKDLKSKEKKREKEEVKKNDKKETQQKKLNEGKQNSSLQKDKIRITGPSNKDKVRLNISTPGREKESNQDISRKNSEKENKAKDKAKDKAKKKNQDKERNQDRNKNKNKEQTKQKNKDKDPRKN